MNVSEIRGQLFDVARSMSCLQTWYENDVFNDKAKIKKAEALIDEARCVLFEVNAQFIS